MSHLMQKMKSVVDSVALNARCSDFLTRQSRNRFGAKLNKKYAERGNLDGY